VFPPAVIPSPQLRQIKRDQEVVKTVEVPTEIMLTPDSVAKLAADQMIYAFATDPKRQTDSEPLSVRLESLDDGMRKSLIARLTFNRGIHCLRANGIHYVVGVAYTGRDGLTMRLNQRSHSPASTL
jgi:hypothetical protein